MAKQYKSVIDELIEQFGEADKAYTMKPHTDKVNFGFPESMTQPMNKQLQAAMVAPGQGKSKPEPFKPDASNRLNPNKKQLDLPASSTIQQAAYWPNREYLVVSFKSGHTYDYQGVELISVLLWEQASSAGSWFYYNIRMKYSYKKIG